MIHFRNTALCTLVLVSVLAATALADPAEDLPGEPPESSSTKDIAHEPAPRPISSGFIAVGGTASHVKEPGERARGKGLLVRAGSRRLSIEGEWLRVSAEQSRLGGGLIVLLRPQRKWSPLLAVGGGMLIDRNERRQTGRYAEVGGGWLLRKRRFGIGFEMRAGLLRDRRSASRDSGQLHMAGYPEPAAEPRLHPARYLRGRLSALLFF